MAVGTLTGRNGMSSGQGEAGSAVIEIRIEPGVGGMAERAVSREATRHMVGTSGRLEIGRMAREAVRRHRLEAAGGASLVATIAIDSRVCASQREAIIVLLDLPDRDLPSEHGVALCAVCSQLAPVDIGMAILAALSNVGKHGFDVALGAGDRGVHASQRVFRLIVVEFRNGADRPPGVGGVAVLARYVQVSVRAVRAG